MTKKINTHQRGRNSRAFEEHSCGRGSASVKKGRAWRFTDPERCLAWLLEEHLRHTARAAALDAKHMRSLRQPLRHSHVKDF
jgi:hypothetical protein